MVQSTSGRWEDLDIAGIRDVNGLVDRPLPIHEPWAPAMVELVGDRLVWSNRPWPRRVDQTPRRLLTDFLELADKPDIAIRDYARRWGVLLICKHGLPATHAQDCWPLKLDQGGEYEYWEPIANWRRFSRQAGALAHIAANILDGRIGDLEQWRAMYRESTASALSPSRAEDGNADSEDYPIKPQVFWRTAWDTQSDRLLRTERSYLSESLGAWLRLANPGLVIQWPDTGPQLAFAGGPLFTRLALALVVATFGAGGIAFCSTCQGVYPPKRQPRVGEQNYCDACRNAGVPHRNAVRVGRARKAARARLDG